MNVHPFSTFGASNFANLRAGKLCEQFVILDTSSGQIQFYSVLIALQAVLFQRSWRPHINFGPLWQHFPN